MFNLQSLLEENDQNLHKKVTSTPPPHIHVYVYVYTHSHLLVIFYAFKGSSGKRQVEVLTKANLQKEYLLVKAKLRLLKKEPTLATQLTSISLNHFTPQSYSFIDIILHGRERERERIIRS
jgi:hypothetical protein